MQDNLSFEVVAAIENNDMAKLTALRNSGETFLGLDTEGNTPLVMAARSKSEETFDFLLTVANTINTVDSRGRTPLIVTLQEPDSEEFSLKLIESDCDIHLVDSEENSALHFAIYYKYIAVSEALIERGADVNCQNHLGKTPLYIACETRLVDEVFMLLFYGADPAIGTVWGYNCLDSLAIHKNDKIQTFFYENLYPHYKTLNLSTFIYAMEYGLPSFSKLIEHTVDITYDWEDLDEFSGKFSFYKSKCFKLFVDKFGYIVEETIDNYHLSVIFECAEDTLHHIGSYVGNLYTIFDSNLAPRLVREIKEKNFPAIYHVLNSFYQHSERVDTIAELICCLLSHGVDPSTEEINRIFLKFGYCELFKIMLHMDIQPIENNGSTHIMPLLIYGVDMTIEKYLANTALYNANTLYDVLGFFSTPALKKFALSLSNHRITTRIRELPVVPTLVELARNSARVYIVKAFKIQNSMQFYTVLKNLPIAHVHKQIIGFEKELYPLQIEYMP